MASLPTSPLPTLSRDNVVADDDAASPTGSAAGLRNFRRYTYWSQISASLGLLAFFLVIGPTPRPPDILGSVTFGAVAVVAIAVVKLTERVIPRRPDSAQLSDRAWRMWTAAGSVAALGVGVLWVALGDEMLWAYAPGLIASIVVAGIRQRRRTIAALGSVAGITGLGLLIGVLQGHEVPAALGLSGALVSGFLLSLTLATAWTWRVAVQLDEARRDAGTLAIARERLRFAAELHDIQGHHLQVIALKSELSRRLVHADPDAAEREMAAVQQLAADAMRDTRAVVHGYRRTSLDTEIANATTVLASAGIDARLHVDRDLDIDDLPEAARHLLGLVVREAITNLLRHSNAAHADVTLTHDGRLHLTITNDGVTDDRLADQAGGLDALAERLRAAGGTLCWHRTDGRFEVAAALPSDPTIHVDGQAPT